MVVAVVDVVVTVVVVIVVLVVAAVCDPCGTGLYPAVLCFSLQQIFCLLTPHLRLSSSSSVKTDLNRENSWHSDSDTHLRPSVQGSVINK